MFDLHAINELHLTLYSNSMHEIIYIIYLPIYKHLHAWLKWLLPGSHPTTQSVSAHVPAPSLSKVYLVKWYMGHYGASSAKPTKGWCNHRKLGELDPGKFNHKMINPKSKPTTVKKTIDKNGKKTWTGTKALKDTQPWPHLLNLHLHGQPI